MDSTGVRLARNSYLMLWIGGLALILTCCASIWLGLRASDYTDLLQRTYILRVDAGRFMNALKDAETGQRGYLLTADPSYLAPYQTATKSLPQLIAELKQVARRPDDLQSIDQLARIVDQKMAELAQAIELERTGRHEAAIALVKTGSGKELMDSARQVAADIVGNANDDVAAQARTMQRLSLWLQSAVILGTILVVVMVGCFVWLVTRYSRQLRQAAVAVDELNQDLEARVNQRTADLQEANDEIQRFAYIVSHDLRAPLVNVMGFTAELDTGIKALRDFVDATEQSPTIPEDIKTIVTEEIPEALDFIRTSTVKMDRLIGAILKLSREGRRVLSSERINMVDLFDNIVTTTKHQVVEAGAEIIVERPMPDLLSDRLVLEQIFGNLIDNAIKYLDHDRPGKVTLSGRVEAGYAVYRIEDNGRGIDKKDYERIFELFRRSGNQDRPGEGIGLAHVRALTRRLGGDITVTSTLGRGTTFVVRLPRAGKKTGDAKK